ncbi:MAG: hypothetical protein NTU62_00155 [Spirochaetes bacterium]|nr:hypothetical protein [Spirochaetota bacterium]
MTKAKVAYDEKTIQTLDALEHIRLRTGMYIGRPALLGLVLAEHLPSLAYGLAAGTLASLAAVYPAARLQSASRPLCGAN